MASTSKLRNGGRIALVVTVVVLAVVTYLGRDEDGVSDKPAPPPDVALPRPQGGSVRLVVLTPPEYSDVGEGGNTLRQLTRPSLFVVYPDGGWRASLAEPGSDGASADGLGVHFRLRSNAKWSDGEAITAADLRRTMDERFVSSVGEPDATGLITVELKQRYPDWRRLWSTGLDPISPVVSGGPFIVASTTSGLETVLRRNDFWYGDRTNLDELRLVLAADAVQARLLLRDGAVDVYRAIDDTVRTTQLRSIAGVAVAVDERSGWNVGLRFDNGDMTPADRRRLMTNFPKTMFVRSLLNGEAAELNGLQGSDLWAQNMVASKDSMNGARVNVSVAPELPLGPLLGATISNVTTEAGGVYDRSSNGDVLLDRTQDGPEVCWTCRFGAVAPNDVSAADTGNRAAQLRVQKRLLDESRYLPLYKPTEVVGWRATAVDGVVPNGFSQGNAWQAERWFVPR